MPAYRVFGPVEHEGQPYGPGDRVDMDERQALHLLCDGLVQPWADTPIPQVAMDVPATEPAPDAPPYSPATDAASPADQAPPAGAGPEAIPAAGAPVAGRHRRTRK